MSTSEYALHILFTNFVRIAEKKMNVILAHPVDQEPNILTIIGPGADPAFDKVLASLGYIATHRPKPVIDSVMFWRKSKSEAANSVINSGHSSSVSAGGPLPHTPTAGSSSQQQQILSTPSKTPVSTALSDGAALPTVPQVPPLLRSFTDPGGRPRYHTHSRSGSGVSSFLATQRQQGNTPPTQTTPGNPRIALILAERKSVASIFILCRTLIEVIKHTTAEALGEELGDRLEDIVYNQLRNADPESLEYSSMRLANWNLFAELLGCMSAIR